jgi:hypothetical protein
MRHGDEGDHRRRGTPSLSAAFHAEQVQPIGHPYAAIVTLEEHVASVGHPEGLPAIGPTVASAGPGPWASTIRHRRTIHCNRRIWRPLVRRRAGGVTVGVAVMVTAT